ncbi:hypothetical protein [Mycolicibacterium fortuitum]|uniref:hypothetical protein n=1 Tax=Mycolicibacterium fortuitum TaxID=1766 RepID=UPI0007E93AC9|nr:hypothetical protein [Mycolicibacterium fortuitum]MDG5784476.1 hypothetical protein [Mycolicibacterium fortuitum]MDV7195809.1 hypothetical protein [Mycolicibacterium fortuitum]NOQ62679.1 hypothetical protein [Mycolicibacterium fortuitum]OBB49085.1 hypothetical protein A5754_31630 [Mycolicibacterium fortuitum]OBB81063.1 hypothetical protein A5755_00210 [Mycolicibacterium fortuitum]
MLDLGNSAFDVAVAVSATGGSVQEWSITLDEQTIRGSSEESRDDAIAAMMRTEPGSECTIAEVGTIRVPHPQAAMAAAVMMLDSRHSYYLTDSVRLVPNSAEIREFLDPFFVC